MNNDFGCVILCPDRSVKALELTVRCLSRFLDVPCVAVAPKGTSRAITDEMKKICDVVRGKETYTSLINVGMSKSKKDWNFIIFAGSIPKPNFQMRYYKVMESELDIIFPIVESKWYFPESSLNGLLLHNNVIKKNGRMPEITDLVEAKTIWAYNAIQNGCKLKGVLGSKIC